MIFKRFNSTLLSSFFLFWVFAQSIWLAYKSRPIQDDYFSIASIQEVGVFGYLRDIWFSHGGNFISYILHSILLLPNTQAFVFWNFFIFFLAAEGMVIFTTLRMINWIFNSNLVLNRKIFLLPGLVIVGFEGLFVPGFVGTFGFSGAVLTHLLPVCATLTAVSYFEDKGKKSILFFSLGFIAGNCSLGESTFALLSCLLYIILHKANYDFRQKIDLRRIRSVLFFGSGVVIGILVIVIAPGFSVRANEQVGLPASFSDFFYRFFRSFFSFSADIFAHPMTWVAVSLGVCGLKLFNLPLENLDKRRVRFLYLLSLSLWLCLIIGGTAAYPAWHQSMGLYLLLIPSCLFLGIQMKSVFWRKFISKLLLPSILIMALCFLRIGILGTTRSQAWDKHLRTNVELLKKDPESSLLGAEIRYPPFGLGIEDVNTWDWMRDKYSKWVLNIAQPSKK